MHHPAPPRQSKSTIGSAVVDTLRASHTQTQALVPSNLKRPNPFGLSNIVSRYHIY